MPSPMTIGLVFDISLGKQRSVLRGIMQYAQTHPRRSFVLDDAGGVSRQSLKSMRASGLIAYVGSRRLAEVLRRHHRPVVNVSSILANAPFPRVMADHRQIGRLAFGHLRDCGLRHFAFVGHSGHLYSTEREAGFREALNRSRFSYDRFLQSSSNSFLRQARRLAVAPGLEEWLKGLPRPVGVFACHDIWGVPVVEAARRGGLRVPDDVAVIGVDDDDLLCQLARPSLSSVAVADERIGFQAAALLDRILRGGKSPEEPILVPPTGVVARQSSDIVAASDPELAAALRFIREHGHRPLRVEDVLGQVRISRRSLELRFRALLQRGIAEELRRVRLEHARQLLASTSLPVADVAARAGFATIYHLSRTFRQQTGQTPTAYRRQFHD